MVMPSRVRHNSRPRVPFLYLIPPPPKKKSMEWLSVIYLSLLGLLLVEKIYKVEKEFLSAVYLSWLVCLLDCGKEQLSSFWDKKFSCFRSIFLACHLSLDILVSLVIISSILVHLGFLDVLISETTSCVTFETFFRLLIRLYLYIHALYWWKVYSICTHNFRKR